MPAIEPKICDFGWSAPDFRLPATNGKTYTLSDIRGKNATLVMYICNHCPYVKAIIERLCADCRALQEHGVGIVAINANDASTYPDDSFENMVLFAENNGFSFPYLHDEAQLVARAYDGICTPDFFGFNRNLELQYRGRFDSSGSNFSAPPSRHELRDAMLEIAKTGQGPAQQTASIGCSIKWHADVS